MVLTEKQQKPCTTSRAKRWSQRRNKTRKDIKGLQICFIINLLYEVLQYDWGLGQQCYRYLIFRYLFLISVGCYIGIYGVKKYK